jgi:hypothetical protein
MRRVPTMPDSDHDRGALGSTSVPAHLARGALGFGLLGAAMALTPSHGPAALLLAPPGLVALRGCPTCWITGLVQTISAGRLERTCTENGCALAPATAGRGTGGARTDAATWEERAMRERAPNGEGTKATRPGSLEEPAPTDPKALRFGWQGLTPRWPRSLRLGTASAFKVAPSRGDCKPPARKTPHVPQKLSREQTGEPREHA